MMPLNLSKELQNKLSSILQAKWKTSGIRYLGLKYSIHISDMVENVGKLFRTIKQQLEHWSKLKVSLFGRIAIIKMNVLPKFNFFFFYICPWLCLIIWSMQYKRLLNDLSGEINNQESGQKSCNRILRKEVLVCQILRNTTEEVS